jgi:hypothetical protein
MVILRDFLATTSFRTQVVFAALLVLYAALLPLVLALSPLFLDFFRVFSNRWVSLTEKVRHVGKLGL